MTRAKLAGEPTRVRLGFVPLTDAAPLLIAKEHGYFAAEGLDVELSREASWSSVRDKVAAGMLDGAHMLAGMPIAATLGIGGLRCPMVTALSLDLNGNAVTVSRELYRRMSELAPETMTRRPVCAVALRKVLEDDRRHERPPVTLATVFPVSSHHYELRYWLCAAGIDPDRDIRLVVVPPHRMVEYLGKRLIDGYCVGEPWNTLAVHDGIGHTLITSYEIWNNSPEKVFAVTARWARRHPRTHRALLRALLRAARWLDLAENRLEAVRSISARRYVDVPEEVVRGSMCDELRRADGLADFHVFFRYAATFPWRSHALWFLTQMARWGQIERPVNLLATAEAVYDCDLYRSVAAEVGVAAPLVDHKSEGLHAEPWTLEQATSPILMGPDRFLDGAVFHPGDPLAYLQGFPISTPRVAREALAAANLSEAS